MSARMPFVFTTVKAGSAAVTNAASGGQLPNVSLHHVVIQAPTTNTKNVFIGPYSASLVSGGFQLSPGDSLSLDIDNLNRMYAGTNAANQVIRYFGVTITL